MNYYESVQNAIDHIEENIQFDIVLSKAADKAYMSFMNFLHISLQSGFQTQSGFNRAFKGKIMCKHFSQEYQERHLFP